MAFGLAPLAQSHDLREDTLRLKLFYFLQTSSASFLNEGCFKVKKCAPFVIKMEAFASCLIHQCPNFEASEWQK